MLENSMQELLIVVWWIEYDLWFERVLMWMLEWWSWCHTF